MVTTKKKPTGYAIRCQECGHTFRSAKAAERAYAGDGCPECGGCDFDESLPIETPKAPAEDFWSDLPRYEGDAR